MPRRIDRSSIGLPHRRETGGEPFEVGLEAVRPVEAEPLGVEVRRDLARVLARHF
jgi:hypothetical protein